MPKIRNSCNYSALFNMQIHQVRIVEILNTQYFALQQ